MIPGFRRTLGDGSSQQRLPVLEVRSVPSQQESAARGRLLWADHRLGQVCKQLQLLGQSLSDDGVLLAQLFCRKGGGEERKRRK